MSFWRRKPIYDAIQFRLVLLNDDDTVKEVLFTSKEYPPQSINGAGEFSKDHYECMMRYNGIYDFCNYDEVPPMEFQYRRKSTKDKWWYLSDTIEDYFNT